MKKTEIRQRIKQYVNQLSPERLLVAADLLAYLAEREDNHDTVESLIISGFKE